MLCVPPISVCKDTLMTQKAVHVFIGGNDDSLAIIGHSNVSRQEAEDQAKKYYATPQGAQASEGGRPMTLYAKAEKPEAIDATRDIATLTADTVYRLMGQGYITHHAGVTL